tara:strand:+ start:514 stop:744 length:231 start_codon:yes stop_codon:yes gene_type:complete
MAEKVTLSNERKRSIEKFHKDAQKKMKLAEKARKTPGTPDDGYKIDYSNLKRKPKPKYKAKGGLIHGKPKLAKKGF